MLPATWTVKWDPIKFSMDSFGIVISSLMFKDAFNNTFKYNYRPYAYKINI